MNERWFRYVLSVAALLAAMNFLSCGKQRRLVTIDVQPPGFKFLTNDPAGQGVFTALGTYKHPPDTRDITAQATWKTDVPQLIQINKGVVSPMPGGVCGIANVYASVNDGGNLITGFATVTVDDPTNKNCPGGSTTLGVVSVNVVGAGMVTSAPGGITCGMQCIAQFNVGDTIGLNAIPSAGHTFSGWTGCAGNGNTCSILVPVGSTSVTATFN